MGLLIKGQWRDEWYDTETTGGHFVRQESQFRNWITTDGSPGPSGTGGFKAEPGRYHLYVSLACPWAHRTLILRKLKGLEDMISISVVNAFMGSDGWTFEPDPGVISDSVNHVTYMHQIYTLAKADFSGRVTVPVLWDKKNHTIVSNESSEIIRMFNRAFDQHGAHDGDYYPPQLKTQIDELNDFIYPNVNNGVYRTSFATTQEAYEVAVVDLFNALNILENRLAKQRYLTGDRITEADWRLFTTLLRFDPVYVGHFKCNKKRLKDYPALWGYVCDLYQVPGVLDTVDMTHIKNHYYRSHPSINPTGIVPVGPDIDYSNPHGRAKLG